ncbi:Tryptophan synthase alpha chain [hydrothermal vent metagenome]|uniref:tryptophan synthase n=1 Tax=hydrothermal vent metagenome TaxID=652676 RepID=A0A3B0ZU80_9ZZZZ
MNRIDACFAELKQQERTALIPYLMAGDPVPGIAVEVMHAMVNAGADLIELGVPFSDPMADGPVIQAASERALKHNTTIQDVFTLVTSFRASNQNTPIILMGYLNPVEVMGYSQFAEAAQQAGVDGVLTVDLPPEEGSELLSAFSDVDLAPVFLIAPTTTEERMPRICKVSRGFVYYVSLKGVTGAAMLDVASVTKKAAHIRSFTDLPVGVGFGIKDAETAAEVAKVADAVVVGSAVVKLFAEHEARPENIAPAVVALLRSMREAMDNN